MALPILCIVASGIDDRRVRLVMLSNGETWDRCRFQEAADAEQRFEFHFFFSSWSDRMGIKKRHEVEAADTWTGPFVHLSRSGEPV